MEENTGPRRPLERQQRSLLRELEEWLETPMIVLAFVWLVLMLVEFLWGLTPLLTTSVTVIWGIFVFDFVLRFGVAPRKLRYLRTNWLTAISLFVPAIRLFRVARAVHLLRAARAARSLRLLRVVSSMNRSMRALRASMARRGVRYVLVLTLIVLLAGAAGMYVFETGLPNGEGFDGYGEAVWWTAMLLTTVGSEYWPQTPEGRILCLLISVYSLGILGYVTASLATYFVGRDAEEEGTEVASARSIEQLQADVRAVRASVEALHERTGHGE